MTQIDFSSRNNLSEWMDADDTDFATFRACLIDLAKVNRLTFAYRPTLSFFDALARTGRLPADRTVTVVDVGSGYGDMVRKIDRWAEQSGFRLELTGIDLNPWSAKAATEATPAGRAIRYVTADIFDYPLTHRNDIVISSLLTHHLDDTTLVRFIRLMEANAGIGWFVNDLRRSAVAYHLFRVASQALRFHPFVRHDGPISIARAFAVSDWKRLIATAGVEPGAVSVNRVFPFRLCVSRFKA